jgi:hypothetical protein
MSDVPNLPPFFNMIYTDKDGSLTANAQLYNDLTYQILNQLIVMINNGLQLPNKTTAEIAAYAADTSVPLGTLWFNSSTGLLQFKDGPGTLQTVTST